MQRTISIILIFFMFFSCAGLGCAESYDQYQVPPYLEFVSAVSFENGDTFYFAPSEKAFHWERNGQAIAVITHERYGCLYFNAGILRIDETGYGILMKSDIDAKAENGSRRIEYWRWSEQGMELLRAWEGGEYFAAYCGLGFLVYEKGKGAALYDASANELWQGDLVEAEEFRRPFYLKMRSAEDWICAVNATCIRVINGRIAWQRTFDGYSSRRLNLLPLADGWTVIALSRRDGQYGPVKIFTIDPEGKIDSTHEISSDKKLPTTAGFMFQSDDGAVLIYGETASNARKISFVWQLRFDKETGSFVWDIRDGEYHGNYEPVLVNENTGYIQSSRVFVKLTVYDGSLAPTVLVPFEELPEVTKHILTVSSIY